MSDGVELGRVEAEEMVFGDLAVAEQTGEDLGQGGVAVVEGVVDPAAALAEPAFQFPQFGGFGDPVGAILRFLEDGIEFPAEGQVEGSAGNGLFRRGPLPIAHRTCCRAVCAGHVVVLPGGILARAGPLPAVVATRRFASQPASRRATLLKQRVE